MNILGGDSIIGDEKIIAALVSTGSVKDAAEMCGVSKVTIYKKLKNPDFKRKYEDACADILLEVKIAIQNKMLGAVDVFSEVMEDRGNKPQVRVNSASEVLRYGLKLTELVDVQDVQREILERLNK